MAHLLSGVVRDSDLEFITQLPMEKKTKQKQSWKTKTIPRPRMPGKGGIDSAKAASAKVLPPVHLHVASHARVTSERLRVARCRIQTVRMHVMRGRGMRTRAGLFGVARMGSCCMHGAGACPAA